MPNPSSLAMYEDWEHPRPDHADILAAGIYLGEGCADIYSGGTPRLSVGMCDKPVIEFLIATYGGTLQWHQARTGRWVWRVQWTGDTALRVADAIRPYCMGAKARQLDLLHEIRRYPPRSAMRQRIIEECKALKRVSYEPS